MLWLWLQRYWLAGGVAVLLLVAAAADANGGAGRWIALAILCLAVFLAAVYALTRFVVWAARRD